VLVASELSSRLIQVPAVFNSSGLREITRTAFSRVIAWNLTTLWPSPPSPASMIRSSSEMITSGAPLRTG